MATWRLSLGDGSYRCWSLISYSTYLTESRLRFREKREETWACKRGSATLSKSRVARQFHEKAVQAPIWAGLATMLFFFPSPGRGGTRND